MTRKEITLIAETMLHTEPIMASHVAHEQWEYMVAEFAEQLAATNPKFSKARFARACGTIVEVD